MNLNLTDRRIVTALAAVFMIGLSCVLLLGLAILVMCAMLVNALVSTIAETVTTIGAVYSHTGPLAHLLMLLAILVGIPYSFKRLRAPVLRFFQRQFVRFSAFAQRAAPTNHAEERDFEEGEVIDLDAKEQEEARQARTAAANRVHSTTTGKPHKQRKNKNKKRQRQAATARAMLTLTRG